MEQGLTSSLDTAIVDDAVSELYTFGSVIGGKGQMLVPICRRRRKKKKDKLTPFTPP